MNKIPVNLVLFTSTAGHFGFDDVCQTTLASLSKLFGSLQFFETKIAHIKVRPSERDKLPPLQSYLEDAGFKIVVTEGDWKRGISMQNDYLREQYKIFSLDELQRSQPYTFWVEDDSPLYVHSRDILYYLNHATLLLSENKNLTHVRFAREGVFGGVNLPLYSPHDDTFVKVNTFDFQPNLCRTRDLYLASLLLQRNWGVVSQMQCEAAMAMAMKNLVPATDECFAAINPIYAGSYHIGTPEYLKYKEKLL